MNKEPILISQDENQNKKRDRSILSLIYFIWDLAKLIIIAFLIVWPIHKFVMQPFYVQGASMEPNFYNYEYLIVDEISYRFKDPERGDVVIIISPQNKKERFIKRIIGLPNERIVIENGKVFIYNQKSPQGKELDESSYLAPGMSTPGKVDIKLEPNQYYVLGDNRYQSLDSRIFGPINRNSIIGKAIFRGWPIERFGLIKGPEYK